MAGGHPNVYLYCANDPVNGKDPSGLQDEYGGFWYHFFRELLKGETWTHGINTGLAATGSAFTLERVGRSATLSAWQVSDAIA